MVAGEFYSNSEFYLNLIDELKIKDRIYLFTDFIPTSDVKYYFSASDAIILPYKDATQSGIVQIAMNFRKMIRIRQLIRKKYLNLFSLKPQSLNLRAKRGTSVII